MKASRYKSKAYKIVALASNLANPGAWPYYVQRLRSPADRAASGRFAPQRSEAIYGPHVHDVDTALQAVGLPGVVRDPRVIHHALFEGGRRKIAALPIPFHNLGLAGESDLRLVYSAAVALPARHILETGVALGWSSLALLTIAEMTDGKLTSVDLPYPFLIGRSWVGTVVPAEMRGRWRLLRQADRIGIPRALRKADGFDLIHYDSDKSAHGRRWAYPRLWEALRPGGLFISDDIGDNEIWAEFCESVGAPLIAVRRHNALAGIVRKPPVYAKRAANDMRRQA